MKIKIVLFIFILTILTFQLACSCGDSVKHINDSECGTDCSVTTWKLMPVRSEGEYNRGEAGGRAEQYMQGAARSRSNPDIIYLSHDCSVTWRSDNGGLTWEKPLNMGLYLPMGQSIEVDPIKSNRVILVLDNSYDWRHTEFTGIYISEDSGDHWEFVQHGPALHSRRYEHNIAWAPSSIDTNGARRWYAALYNETDDPGKAIYISNDYGHTWQKGASLSGHNPVYEIQISPANAQILLIAGSQGLIISRDGGTSITSAGDLPAGHVTSVAFDPENAETVYAVLRESAANGLYRSVNGGTTFTRLSSSNSSHQSVLSDARRIFIHPYNGSVFYILPQSSSLTAIRTENSGSSYETVNFSLPSDVRAWRWGITLSGDMSFVLMNAGDDKNVVAQSRGAALYRSTDGGIFINGSTLFDGANCGLTNFGIAFDRYDPERFALGNADIGMYYTNNGGDWFSARSIPWDWVSSSTVAWGSQHTLDFNPSPDHYGHVVSSVGDVFNKKLARSPDNGKTWEIVDNDVNYYWRVAYNPSDPDIVFAGNKRSLNGGATFEPLPIPDELNDDNLQFMDYCRAHPDTIYATSRSSRRILRSDDSGDTWSLYAEAPGNMAPFDPIITFAVDPVNPFIIYTLDGQGDLARFDGTTWASLGVLQHVDAPVGYYIYVRSVMIDPNHPEIIYAGIFGSGISSIFRSIDNGMTWEDISYNRFREGVSGINISPINGEVMVGGCSGTWILPPPYPYRNGIYHKLDFGMDLYKSK